MDENVNIKDIIEKETDALWKKAFTEGMMAGWFACCVSMCEETKNLHSAKAYHKFLRQKRDEAKARLTVDKSDHTEA